jgi:hypothetical protein
MNVSLQAPAVSEINGKVDYSGGSMDSHTGDNFGGSVTFPLGQRFGFQADGLYSRISDSDFYGGAGHLFWRKPDTGLLGVTGGYLYRSGVDTYQVGAEGEYYLGRFTLGAFAGFGSISYANPAPFIDTQPNRFVGSVSVDYYVLDDLRLGAAYVTAFGDNLGKGEIEYQTPLSGLAFTAEGSAGDHGYYDWLLGVRYYFGGGSKSLRDRHRQDDPPGLMPQILQGLGLYGAEFNQKGNAYLAAHPGSGSTGTYGTIISGTTDSSSGSYGVTITEVNRLDGFGSGAKLFTPTTPPTPPSTTINGAGSVGVPFTSPSGVTVEIPSDSSSIGQGRGYIEQ